MLRRGLLFMVLISVGVNELHAQTEDCEQTLTRANDEFNAGHFYSIASILDPCLKDFSREQRQRAYLLLTQTYLLLDDPIGAKQSYLQVLMANPEFVTDESIHSIDVIYLSKKFTATPIFSWFAKLGPNVSPVRLIYDLDAAGESDFREKYFLRVGFHFGVGGEYSYNERLSLKAELNFQQTTYRHESSGLFSKDSKIFTDRQSWINVPVYATYSDDKGRYRPYGYIGYAAQLLLADRATIEIINAETTSDTQLPAETPSINLKYSRQNFNQSVIFGGGLKIKIGLDFIFADVRYAMGLKNVINPKKSYGDTDLNPISNEFVASMNQVSSYGHVDDYFRLDNLSISFGFIRPLYKPRELKKARTKSVLRKMKQ